MIGIILFLIIMSFVFIRVYTTQGCFKPMFRGGDVKRYMCTHGLSDKEGVKFVREWKDKGCIPFGENSEVRLYDPDNDCLTKETNITGDL